MQNEIQTLEIQTTPGDVGTRLDVFLSEKLAEWSRSRIKKLIGEGNVRVNGKDARASHKIRDNEHISVELAEETAGRFEPENIALDIVFEDEFLAVINKPAGMVVHPGAGVSGGTLANAIAWHFDLRPSEDTGRTRGRAGIVHRLDKNTSGLIVVARNEITHDRLARQFSERRVFKSYMALAHGFVRKRAGKIDAPIGRDRKNRVKMAVTKGGRNAVTIYKVRQRFERFTLLDLEIKTGRTHQIRVHLAHIKHPVVGDTTYNAGRDKMIPDALVRKRLKELDRFFLHSAKLAFVHPVSKERMSFEAGLPAGLRDFLALIGEG